MAQVLEIMRALQDDVAASRMAQERMQTDLAASQGPEVRYQALEKAALAVVFSARRLRHYFHSFTVVVMTIFPSKRC